MVPQILAGALIVLAAFGACGGDDSAVAKPGPLVCDTLLQGSYHYIAHVTEGVDNAPGTPAPSASPALPAATFTWDIQGAIVGAKFDVTVRNTAGQSGEGQSSEYEAIDLGSGQGYLNLKDTGQGWQNHDTSYSPLVVPYRPADLCSALGPDVDTSKLASGQAEAVNGIASQRFALQGFATQFFARDPDFGPASDAARNIHTVDGTIWVANQGNYVSKLDISGAGQYPNGQTISVKLTLEVSDVGGDVKVTAPQ
jgi:hypothetical protein